MTVATRDMCPHSRDTVSSQLRLTPQHSRFLLLLRAQVYVCEHTRRRSQQRHSLTPAHRRQLQREL